MRTLFSSKNREEIKSCLFQSSIKIPLPKYVLPPEITAYKNPAGPEAERDCHGPAHVAVHEESSTIGGKPCHTRDSKLDTRNEEEDNDEGVCPMPDPQF